MIETFPFHTTPVGIRIQQLKNELTRGAKLTDKEALDLVCMAETLALEVQRLEGELARKAQTVTQFVEAYTETPPEVVKMGRVPA